MPLKIDLHMHTHYSSDATTTLRQVVQYAKKRGLDGVAITDHDTLLGALRLARQRDLLVIPGMEIETTKGHILAMDIGEHFGEALDTELTFSTVIEKIHEADGTAVVAHPASMLKSGLGNKILSETDIDAIEVVNSAAFPFFLSTRLSRRLAKQLKLPQTAGSDSHHPQEIGKAYTLVDADSNVDDVIEAIKKGKTVPCGKPISWIMRIERGASGVRETLRRHQS